MQNGKNPLTYSMGRLQLQRQPTAYFHLPQNKLAALRKVKNCKDKRETTEEANSEECNGTKLVRWLWVYHIWYLSMTYVVGSCSKS